MKRIVLTLLSMMLICTNSVQTSPVLAEEETGMDSSVLDPTPTPAADAVSSDDPSVTDDSQNIDGSEDTADGTGNDENTGEDGSSEDSADDIGDAGNDDPIVFTARSTNTGATQTGTFYNADGSSYTISDLGMTLQEAADDLAMQDFFAQQGVMMMASSPVYRMARVAEYHNAFNGLPEYVSMFTINGRPAYCIEPYVAVTLDGNGNGPIYDSQTLFDLNAEQAMKVGRIMWYGYGHPMSGDTPRYYMATQLLIWKIVVPTEYAEIVPTLKECTPADQACAVTGGLMDVSAEMDVIMNLVDNRDTVPSFANEWHGVEDYELDWNETLTLTDTNNVLDWFNDNSEESHNGINIKRDGNKLLIDIDDLYYEGYDSAKGKTLTFKRTEGQWLNYLDSLLLWVSGSNQKLAGSSYWDPTPQYQMSFKLKTADLSVQKLDEYYNPSNFTAGTQFYVGWYEDPETQYQQTGNGDPNWTGQHNPNQQTKDDKDGNSNVSNGSRMYYPIMTDDGSAIRIFTVGNDGVLHIDGLLPQNKKWWIREVNATNPYDLDNRVWSASTGAQGTTTVSKFANKLRDVTLSLIKKDEDDQYTKINGATYRVYEVGDLDLSKDPTQYGKEADLDRLHNPTLTYNQLAENSNLQVGDSFIFNNYLYEIVSDEETQYVVKAVDKTTYTPVVSNVFSRYQIQTATVGEQVQVTDTLKQHGTYDAADDKANVRSLEVSDVKDAGTGCAVYLNETENKANILINSTSNPTFDEFNNAAALAGKSLKVGLRVTVNNIDYTIKKLNDGSLIASADQQYVVNLDEVAPSYYDIPNARSVKPGDTFTLSYPATTDCTSFTTESLDFEVISSNAYSIVVEADGVQYTVAVPEWISYEDVPETVQEAQSFTVTKVTNPKYEVTDSRGNKYLVADDGTTVLTDAEDAKTTDIDYLYMIGSYTVDPNTGDITEDPAGFTNGGACVEPYNISGCPVGTTQMKKLPKTTVIPYTGVQYDDLTDVQKATAVDAVFGVNGVAYKVVKADDGTSMTVAVVYNGDEYIAVLTSGANCPNAAHTEILDVEFTVAAVTPKEVDLTWDTISVPKNSLANDNTIHLVRYADETTQGDLSWNSIPDTDAAVGSEFTDENGVVYKFIYNDTVNHKIVLESNKGRYEVTTEYVKNVTPIKYSEYVAAEQANGAAFVAGDTVTSTHDRAIAAGDEFEVDGHTYFVKDTDYVMENGTLKLKDGSNYTKTLIYAWEQDAPFSYGEILENFAGNTTYTDPNGTVYTLTATAVNGKPVYVLDDGNGNSWNYCTVDVTNDSPAKPYESKTPEYNLQISKPTEISYTDYTNAATNKKAVGDKFTVGGTQYKIVKVETHANGMSEVTIKDLTAKVEYVIHEDPANVDPSEPITFADYTAAVRDITVGDKFTVNGTEYQVLNITTDPNHGVIVRVKNLSTKKTIDVMEDPDSNFYDTERIYNYIINTDYLVSDQFQNAYDMRLQSENPHITLTKTEVKDADGNITKYNVMLKGEQNASATLLLLDADGNTIDTKTIVISTDGTYGSVDGLVMFEGQTGRQYIRLVDSNNHNYPLPYYKTTIYTDKEMKKAYGTLQADETGTVDVTDLPEGTYYYPDVMVEGNSVCFEVKRKDSVEGQLSISGLKWGRTYMACELKLPDGYDYGTNEVCRTFTMDAADNTSVMNQQLSNKLRKLDLKVFKVDHNDHSILLNGAWFTITDVTDADTVIDKKTSSSFKQLIDVLDIPNNAEVGDEVVIWRPKTDGVKTSYTIEKILEDQIVVSSGDKEYYIPKKGFSTTAPMLYTDIFKALGADFKEGNVFQITEKEGLGTVKKYQVLAVTKMNAVDIFGNPLPEMVIETATVYDVDDANKTPIEIKAIQSDATYGEENIGDFVSGGILAQAFEDVADIAISWDDMVAQVGTIDVDDTFDVNVRTVITIPTVDDYLKALGVDSVDDVNVGTVLNHDEKDKWEVIAVDNGTLTIRCYDAVATIREGMLDGNAVTHVMTEMKITAITKDAAGEILGVTYEDPTGNSYYIKKDQKQVMSKQGKPGVETLVSDKADMSNIIASGYTDEAGQSVFMDLADGTYFVSRDGVVTEEQVAKGMIFLPEVSYGHSLKICETKSPLGYIVGNACEVFTPTADYATRTVNNYRTNKKKVYWEGGGRRWRIRRMGVIDNEVA